MNNWFKEKIITPTFKFVKKIYLSFLKPLSRKIFYDFFYKGIILYFVIGLKTTFRYLKFFFLGVVPRFLQIIFQEIKEFFIFTSESLHNLEKAPLSRQIELIIAFFFTLTITLAFLYLGVV